MLQTRLTRFSLTIGAILTSPSFAHNDVVFPDGNETFRVGETVTVEWTVTIAHVLVDWDVFYSTNGPAGPWIPVELGVPPGDEFVGSVHTIEWIVPNELTSNARILVRMNGPAAFWEDTSAADFTIAPSPGARECNGQASNSSGRAASIHATGSIVASQNAMTLTVLDLPTNALGYVLNSRDAGFAAMPGGAQGNLCLGGAIGRHAAQIANSGGDGIAHVPLDLTALPRPTGTAGVVAGETWRFQYWTRDANPNPTSNFSDSIAVTFM